MEGVGFLECEERPGGKKQSPVLTRTRKIETGLFEIPNWDSDITRYLRLGPAKREHAPQPPFYLELLVELVAPYATINGLRIGIQRRGAHCLGALPDTRA